jgi:GMP synthase (glutamine-hydrolysing)
MILIVDFGSQTAHLIGRRLRQLGIQAEYVNPEETLQFTKNKLKPKTQNPQSETNSKTQNIKSSNLKGIILSGGPSSVYEKGAPTISKEIFELGIPVLGICYGWQLMAKLLGGSVENGTKE